jgi:hypothetical protein
MAHEDEIEIFTHQKLRMLKVVVNGESILLTPDHARLVADALASGAALCEEQPEMEDGSTAAR